MDKPERLIALTHTNYGFRWGPVEVSRASADPKHGVWLILRSAKQEVTIRVTRSGLFRIGDVEPAPSDPA